MIINVIKGMILILFTIVIYPIGFLAEAICIPLSKSSKDVLIKNFVNDLWENSFK